MNNVTDAVGKAAAPWDANAVDWVPTLNLGHSKFDATSNASKRTDTSRRLQQRKRRIAEVLVQLHKEVRHVR